MTFAFDKDFRGWRDENDSSLHGVAGTAERARGTRARSSKEAGGKRQRAAARAATASAVDEHLTQHAQTAPHTD